MIQSDWPGSISGSLQLLVFFGRGCEVIRPGLMAEARQDEQSESSSLSGNASAHTRRQSAACWSKPSRVSCVYRMCTSMYEHSLLHGLRGRTRFKSSAWPGWRGVACARGCGPGSRASLLKNFRSLETRHVGFVHVCMYIQVHVYAKSDQPPCTKESVQVCTYST